MTLREALQSTARILREGKIEDAFAEAELLLGRAVGMSRTQIYTEPARKLNPAETRELVLMIQRRLNHEPSSYILQECEFYGLDFHVEHGVFIPRPETEVLVEQALNFADHLGNAKKKIKIADIGTGCGAIAISLALALPKSKIYATDISHLALKVARINCRRHGVENQVELLLGNLLEPLPEAVDIIVANLPYVREDEFGDLSPEIVNFEPEIALLGGKDGLEKIKQLVEQAPAKLSPEGALIFEIGHGQREAVHSLISGYLPQARIQIVPDPAGIDRVVKVTLGSKADGADKAISRTYLAVQEDRSVHWGRGQHRVGDT